MALSYGNSQGIAVELEGPFGGSGGTVSKTGQIRLYASVWKGAVSPFSQGVEAAFVSANSRVELHPAREDLQKLFDRGIALAAENDGGTVTVYAFGAAPDWDMTVQAEAQEVVMV